MNNFDEIVQELEAEIMASYTEGITIMQAEKLAGKFLHAQMATSAELSKGDLDSRMRKSGLKAVKAAVYTDACTKTEKKPTESALEHLLNANELVNGEQLALDRAEVRRDELERLYSVFQAAHVHFRTIAKGVFGS